MDDITEYEESYNTSRNQRIQSLNFTNSENSGESSKKRKINDTIYEMTQRDTVNDSLNSTESISGQYFPWEVKILRIDLMQAHTQIDHLKKEIQHQATIQQELELKFLAKEKSLESDLSRYKAKAEEFEKLVKKNRKNEQQLKTDAIKATNQLREVKQTYDQTLFKLQSENQQLKESLNYKTNSLQNKISELSRELAETKSFSEATKVELKSLQETNKELLEKLDENKEAKKELEKAKLNYQEAEMKIKALEYEVNSFGDWKEVEKTSLSRMTSATHNEKEVQRLTQIVKNLQSAIGNKMLLEERAYSYETRVEHFEKEREKFIDLEVKVNALEKELADWKKIGDDFVSEGYAPNPINVRSYIERLLHRDLQLASEKTNISSEKSTVNCEVNELKTKLVELDKDNEKLRNALKTHQTIIFKLQKKTKIFQSERDSYRQVIDCYEKELTINPNTATSNNAQDTKNRLQIEMLTNSLSSYKEMCARLEQENMELRGCPQSGSDSLFSTSEHYKKIRKDMDELRYENEKLRKRKNELEIEVENLTLRNNCMAGENHLKVVHFKDNPASIAQKQVADEVVKLKAEIERLRARNKKLEEGNDDLTTRINETMNMTMNIKDLQKLKEQYAQLQLKYQENEKLFTSINKELREVIYMLFGYKLDRYGTKNYRITSMFADNENDELLFQLNDEGTLDMLETEYSKTPLFTGLVTQYLQSSNGSLPSFTAALTLELVNRMTVTTVS